MLTTLRIKNLALVSDLTLELQPGCNVITGETGAGKSIILGALNLVLGERADRTLIRSGEESCSVEAVFDVSSNFSLFRARYAEPNFLEENGLEPCEENQLVLKRTFTSAGTNRQFINGSPTTLATLGRARRMAGGHARPARSSVAAASGEATGDSRRVRWLGKGTRGVRRIVRRRAALEAEKSALIVDEKTYAQQLDLLRFQVQEISTARLQPAKTRKLRRNFIAPATPRSCCN